MLTDSTLRSQVDALWDKLWSGALSNPLDAIEQLSFLFFLKRLDEREQYAERAGRLPGKKHQPLFPDQEFICDPAAGTCGFPVGDYQHLPEAHPHPDNLIYDDDGYPHHLIGDQLAAEEHKVLQAHALTGYDSDSGMTMLRIGCMNLMLHGIE